MEKITNSTVLSSAGESSSDLGTEDERRKALLQSFTSEEDKRIRRKIDRRFLFLIGMMYIIKTIDYTNAASVKVLQVGEDRNVLNELMMTSDEYNWVQSIYFVSSPLIPLQNSDLAVLSSVHSYQEQNMNEE
ncbi:hypothetical protein APSETT444_004758 [Aspergillus pseudonomiae]